MQKHALQAVVAHCLVELKITVFRIARHRMARVCRMHANLVRTPRENRHFEQRGDATKTLHGTKIAGRAFAGGLNLHRAFTADAQISAQRRIDAFLAELPTAFDEREVAFLEAFAFAQSRVQHAQHRGLAGDEQHAARIAIESMYELELVALVGPSCAERLDHAKTESAAAVHRKPRGFVDDEQPLVLEDDGLGDGRDQRSRNSAADRSGGPSRRNRSGLRGLTARRTDAYFDTPLPRLEPNRRQTHLVPQGKAGVDPRPLAVDPHLALANDAEKPTLRDFRVLTGQEPVEPGPRIVLVHRDVTDGGLFRFIRKTLFFHGLYHRIMGSRERMPMFGPLPQALARRPPAGTGLTASPEASDAC